jgi:hypothetical protein
MSAPVDSNSRLVSHGVWAVLAAVLTLVLVAGGAFAIARGGGDRMSMHGTSTGASATYGHHGRMMSWARSHSGDLAPMRDHMDDGRWMRHHDGQWRWTSTHGSMWTWMRGHWDDMARLHDRCEQRNHRSGLNNDDGWWRRGPDRDDDSWGCW